MAQPWFPLLSALKVTREVSLSRIEVLGPNVASALALESPYQQGGDPLPGPFYFRDSICREDGSFVYHTPDSERMECVRLQRVCYRLHTPLVSSE